MSDPPNPETGGGERDLLEKVRGTIEREGLLGRDETILVAVSGGPDSVALLHILAELSAGRAWTFAGIHIHHGLRGEEADADADLARRAAEKLRVPFETDSIQPGTNPSEDHLRRLRYDVLAARARKVGATAVALGHQRDDQVETVLHRIARGSGIRGLAGIPFSRELADSGGARLVRPLLDCSREEILAYLSAREIPWREDRSNKDTLYTRNRIRHEVLPVLEEALNPNIRVSLARLSTLARDALEILETEGRRILREGREAGNPQGGIRVDRWETLSPIVLGEALRFAYLEAGGMEGGFTYETVQGLLAAIRSGETTYHATWPGGIPLRLREGRLFLGETAEPPEPAPLPIEVPGRASFPRGGLELRSNLTSRMEMEKEGGPAGTDPGRVWFDWEALSPPLSLRPWRKEDTLHPFGGPSIKEVREVLADAKVPRADRSRLPVVADREGVIWIVGVRRSARAPVTEDTSRVLSLKSAPLQE